MNKAKAHGVVLKNPYHESTLEIGGGALTLMGVVNCSPESANKDTYAPDPDAAQALAQHYGEWGVKVVDVGGQSSNYQNQGVTVSEEIRRVVPTVEILAENGWVISVDTYRPEVAAAALKAGASLVNDTSGLRKPEMIELATETGAPFVLMYIEGEDPRSVGGYSVSDQKVEKMADLFVRRIKDLNLQGITQLIIDTGTGISYSSDYDHYSKSQFEIAERLQALSVLSDPVMYSVPRKKDRYRNASLAALAIAGGASMLRIHDVEMISDIAWLMGRLPNKPGPSKPGPNKGGGQ